jgi:tetratricopeptide (TPR) repeat protein
VAWNYYGVALQGSGHPDDSANAYLHALSLDRDLLEARLNLGILHLEQGQPDAAKTELTAYTLRRPNDPIGWLKLGSAQLKLNEIVSAERSFSAVLALKTNEAEAYNGLGMARILRGKPGEAAKFFTAAVGAQADYAPAFLNLATVNHEYLHNDQAALENYHAYLALTPRPADWDEVKALADSLEQPAPVAAKTATPAPVTTPAPKPEPKPVVAIAPVPPVAKPATPAPAHVATEPQPQPRVTYVPAPRRLESPRAQSAKTPEVRPEPAPAQVVQVAPEPELVTTPRAATTTSTKPASTPVPISNPTSENAKYTVNGVTPLPDGAGASSAPVVLIPPAPVNFPRYNYLNPRKPAAGDRRAASGAFTQARRAEQQEKWPEALQQYREAAALDPSWFEAQYNAGVIAQRLRNYSSALASYEHALAVEPDSVEARYNFALTLQAAGYAPDAANELKKILAAKPDEVRAHLALAYLCAKELHDPAQARVHYQKVLALDPTNPRASEIRYWLVANPG